MFCLQTLLFASILLVRPEVIACGADLCFSPDVFSSTARSPRCVGRPAWNFVR